jgi:hypothetical protein
VQEAAGRMQMAVFGQCSLSVRQVTGDLPGCDTFLAATEREAQTFSRHDGSFDHTLCCCSYTAAA